MNKSFITLIAMALACGANASIAQNVKSDQDKAQGQEQRMQEKEKGTSGAQQSAPNERERARSDDSRSAPSASGEANDCKGMTGRAKEQCLKKSPAATGQTDSGTAQPREGQKQQ